MSTVRFDLPLSALKNRYEGGWEDGEPNGWGKMIFVMSGDVYEGEWKHGKQNGHGKMTYVSGNVYEGEWKDDKRSGRGKETFTNGFKSLLLARSRATPATHVRGTTKKM